MIDGHTGIRKTIARIQNNYTWIGLHQDVIECLVCQEVKVNRKSVKSTLKITDSPLKFNDKIAIDICMLPYRRRRRL